MIATVALAGAACGSDELAGADLPLDREVVLTYDIPEVLEGQSFTVTAVAHEVVGQETRSRVRLINESDVIEETCAEAMEIAEQRVAELGVTANLVCREETRELTERFHEFEVVDASGEVTLQLSSDASLPYSVLVRVITEEMHSGCRSFGPVDLEPDQDRLHIAVDDDYLCDGD